MNNLFTVVKSDTVLLVNKNMLRNNIDTVKYL